MSPQAAMDITTLPDVATGESAVELFNKLPIPHRKVIMHFLNPDSRGYLNQTRAYLEVYPDSQVDSARSSASDILTSPTAKSLLSVLLPCDVESLQTELRLASVAARDKGDIANWRGSVMDVAKLKGLLVDKVQEVGTPARNLTQSELVKELERRVLVVKGESTSK